jgi:hypothetical protein
MSIFIDPVTQQRVVYAKHSGDIQYDLTGDSAISQETVPIIGSWEDWTGSETVHNIQMTAGRSNALDGTDPALRGVRIPDLGEVGQNIQTTRRRTIRRRAEINGNKIEVYDERITRP